MKQKVKKEKVKDNRSFAEKHPRWNFVIGLILLLGITGGTIYIATVVIQYVVKVGTKLISWVSETLPKMDAVVVVALITGAVSILGVLLSSIVAKALEYKRARREYLTQKREAPYSEFVEMVYKIQQSAKPGREYPQEEMIDDLLRFSKQITLWGSPRVVNNWVKFKENALKTDSGLDNLLLTEEIMNDMRRDLGLRKVKKGNLLAFFVNDIKDAIKKAGK